MCAVVRYQITAVGRVQGVNYRWFTEKTARELGLKGWVTNLDNGNVEAEVEGEQEKVDELVERMRVGPPLARVDHLAVSSLGEVFGYKEFRVR